MPEPAHHFQRSAHHFQHTPHPADPFADEPAVTDVQYDDAVDDDYEDGNALAGPLSELFAVDVVSAQGQCTGCGTTGPIAQLRVYGPGPGLVARCPVCGQVVLRVVRGTESAWLDLRGTVSLQFRLGADR
ncbi:DUF6510 family protein [Catenulispora pinisilvae]|uniref:DUF6510 family protein n=1 Tax=Catenulispora pinisilvae TaxID=2705253 RepID=UPI001E3005B8|nr:DUF6510 family protein [Catenulispora pinisilvae]